MDLITNVCNRARKEGRRKEEEQPNPTQPNAYPNASRTSNERLIDQMSVCITDRQTDKVPKGSEAKERDFGLVTACLQLRRVNTLMPFLFHSSLFFFLLNTKYHLFLSFILFTIFTLNFKSFKSI